MTKTPAPASHAVNTAPFAADLRGIGQPVAPGFDLRTSAGGRAYIAWHFANVLERHDFGNYIREALAADFACALARHLRAYRAHIVDLETQLAAIGAGGVEPLRQRQRLHQIAEPATAGLRCHDAEACLMGQRPCPTPRACGCEALAVQPSRECLQQSAEPVAVKGCKINLQRMRNAALHAQAHGYVFTANGSEVRQVIDLLHETTRELEALQAAPPAPAGVAVPDGWMENLGFELDAPADGVWMVIDDTGARREAGLVERVLWKELVAIRAALAAAPAQAVPESHTKALEAIATCPVADIRMNAAAANMRGIAQRALAAPAQAVVVPDETTPEYGSMDLGWSMFPPLADGEKRLMALITNLFGNDHQAFNDLDALVNRARLAPAAPAQEHATQLAGQGVEGETVAYLDLGAGGYLDIGTDLSDEQLSKLPKGRHMLVISGTHGVDGYAAVPAQVQDVPTPWLPYLSDRADGVRGHYAIARHNPAGYREVWNLRRHHWAAASDEVLTLEEALAILRKLAMPTAPAAPIPAQENARDALTLADQAWNFDSGAYESTRKANAEMLCKLQDCAQTIRSQHARIAELEAQGQPAREPLTPEQAATNAAVLGDPLTRALYLAWAKAEPRHPVTHYPTSYFASFRDMADAARAHGTTKEAQ